MTAATIAWAVGSNYSLIMPLTSLYFNYFKNCICLNKVLSSVIPAELFPVSLVLNCLIFYDHKTREKYYDMFVGTVPAICYLFADIPHLYCEYI